MIPTDLARRLRRRRGERHGRDAVGAGDPFLQKPFSAVELLRCVRAALGGG